MHCNAAVICIYMEACFVTLHHPAGGEDEKPSSSEPDIPRSSKIGPAASLLLQGAGLTKEDVSPSGPGGIVTKGDVMRAIAGAAGSKPCDTPVDRLSSTLQTPTCIRACFELMIAPDQQSVPFCRWRKARRQARSTAKGREACRGSRAAGEGTGSEEQFSAQGRAEEVAASTSTSGAGGRSEQTDGAAAEPRFETAGNPGGADAAAGPAHP